MQENSFVYFNPSNSDNQEEKNNPEDVTYFLVKRMEELSVIKQKHAETTERLVAAKIRELDLSIRTELESMKKAETRCRNFSERLKKWTAPALVQRAQVFTSTQEAEARLRGLEEGLRVQAAGMRQIDRVARDQIEEIKRKITRLYRNTDAMSRSLGETSEHEHNGELKLSIYLSQRHLSQTGKSCDQARAEIKSRDADVAEFKIEEIGRLIHQSNVELELLRANIERQSKVWRSEMSRTSYEDLMPADPEHAKFLRDMETLRNERDEKRKRLESLETQLENMRNKRQSLEREFRELKVALKALAPSQCSNVDIAKQQMIEIEMIERKRKEISNRFKERKKTIALESRLAEEVKWRNRIDVVIQASKLRSKTFSAQDDEVAEENNFIETAQSVETSFRDDLENRVSMLRREKEKRARLSALSRERLDELEADLSRVEEIKRKLTKQKDETVRRRIRLKNLKQTYREAWRSDKIDSRSVEKFLMLIHSASSFTSEMISTCKSRLATMRKSLPLIRTCRVDHQHRLHVFELILHLREFVATCPRKLSSSMAQALQELGLVLPDLSESPATQRVQFASLRDTLISTYSHLTSELSDLDTKLLRDIKLLEDSAKGTYVFKYRGKCVSETVQEDKKMLSKRPNFVRWERMMRSSLWGGGV
jgi:hypothetical protein